MLRLRQLANHVLSRFPYLYKKILLLKNRRNLNLDKLIFLSLIRDGDVVFDIGANTGYFTILFSHLAGENGSVHAFEPVPHTYQALKAKVETEKRYDNVHLNELAVSDIAGSSTIHIPGEFHEQASLRPHDYGFWSEPSQIESCEISVTTLDQYIEKHPISSLDFLKVDTEGNELPVLRGAAQTLSTHQPVCYLEIFNEWSKDYQYSSFDLLDFLGKFGYSKFFVVGGGIRELALPLAEPLPECLNGPANIICTIPALHDHRTANLADIRHSCKRFN